MCFQNLDQSKDPDLRTTREIRKNLYHIETLQRTKISQKIEKKTSPILFQFSKHRNRDDPISKFKINRQKSNGHGHLIIGSVTSGVDL